MKKHTEFARQNRKEATFAEKLLWGYLRNRRLGGFRFVREYPVVYDTNKLTGRKEFFLLDFYCQEFSLAIELDGEIHNQQLEYDAWRTSILNAMGITVIRFKNEELDKDMNVVLNKILTVLQKNKF